MFFYARVADAPPSVFEVAQTGLDSASISVPRREPPAVNGTSASAGGGSGARRSGSGGSIANSSVPKSVIPQTFLAHSHIITSVFWVGEPATSENGYISNAPSTWDESWQQHFGGFDDPDNRNGYLPAGFTPHENPFYFALPYNDIDDNGNRRPSASSCPEAASKQNQKISWCKNTWMAITNDANGKTCYAQWEDAGPYGENDTSYVFGTAAPANKTGLKAGLDVSPAARDCLGMGDEAKTTWHFVNAASVPAGPWKQIITTTPSYEVD